eukprot:155534-Pelagomonas_calceolata.AAC.1
MVNVIWHPTWEAADVLLENTDYKPHVQSFEQSHTQNTLPHQRLPAADASIDNPTRQGYEGSTEPLQSHWLTTQ